MKKSDESREMYKVNGKNFNAKVNLDKYYTPIELAKYCIDKAYEIIGRENITEIIEPSAGCGNFSLQIPNCIAYDIEPEHNSIIKKDFFEINLPYKEGRLVIGNPPYGHRGHLSLQFFKHSIQMAEYISFILPASQYNNNYRTYEYDLIYSELISGKDFKDLYIDGKKENKFAFNIYKRPNNGLNKRKKYKFEDFELFEYVESRGRKYQENYDFKILTWGRNCGRMLKRDEFYAKEVMFYIHNEEFKKPIRELFESGNIMKEYYMTSTPNITLWMIYEYILKYIPNKK